MSVKHAQAVEAQVVKTGAKTTIQVLISSQEGPNFALRRFTMEPGNSLLEHSRND
jgi:quercetin dioxygenase-like cupin family protein